MRKSKRERELCGLLTLLEGYGPLILSDPILARKVGRIAAPVRDNVLIAYDRRKRKTIVGLIKLH